MKRRIVWLLIVLIITVGLLGLAITINQNARPIHRLLRGCESPCWMGIKAGTTTYSELLQILTDAEIDQNVVGGVDEPSISSIVQWKFGSSYTTATVQNGLVIQLAIPIDACVSDVLREYGNPLAYLPGSNARLMYPDESIMFVVSASNPADIAGVFIVSKDEMEGWLHQPSVINWSKEIFTRHSGTCTE